MTNSSVEIGTTCTYYGWGLPKSVSFSESRLFNLKNLILLQLSGPTELLKGDIEVVDASECSENYHNHFCAGPSHIGGCEGDDGGAVVCGDILHGLVGWRYEGYCSETIKAHSYVDLSSIKEWIVTITNDSGKLHSSIMFAVVAGVVTLVNYK